MREGTPNSPRDSGSFGPLTDIAFNRLLLQVNQADIARDMVYYYEGIANLSAEEEWHTNAFYAALACKMENQSDNAGLFFKEKYNRIVDCIGRLSDGESKASLCKDGYSRINAWNKKYQVVVAGTSDVLVVHPKETVNGELVDISCVVKPSYYNRAFSNLKLLDILSSMRTSTRAYRAI
jgi:hypothetical protein